MTAIITIQSSRLYQPIVLDGIEWETARKGEPGKLTFTVVKDEIISFSEGNEVTLTVDGRLVFFGYVFKKERDKNHHIKVTAYDQLRYLKNKHVFQYTGTASNLIKNLASDFGLRVGQIDDTKYIIPARIEDNVTLFDIIQNALDITFDATGILYCLYDNVGRLTLRNIATMQLNTVIDGETAANFDYSTSIDGETFNKILLYSDSGDGKREYQPKPAEDSTNIARWGLLQKVMKVDNSQNLQAVANTLLKSYNKKTRSLRVVGALGDVDVRAGCFMPVMLNLGDIINSSYLLCERVTHVFSNNEHTMNISFAGGDRFV